MILFKNSASTYCCSIIHSKNSLRCASSADFSSLVCWTLYWWRWKFFVRIRYKEHLEMSIIWRVLNWSFWTLSNTITNWFDVLSWRTSWRTVIVFMIANWSNLHNYFNMFTVDTVKWLYRHNFLRKLWNVAVTPSLFLKYF